MNHTLRSASLGVFTLLTASVTYAQEPCGEDACPVGYTCELSTYERCSGACAPSPAPGQPGECSEVSCETFSFESCVPAPCETDDDCGDEMVCHTLLVPQAPSAPSSCAPGGNCEQLMAPPPVEPLELKQCTPRSELPCEQNSDCGEGFDCAPSVSCSCPGSAPSPSAPTSSAAPAPAPMPPEQEDVAGDVGAEPLPPVDLPVPPASVDGGAAPPIPPDECTCGPTGTNYCQMREIPCSSDADCPTNWNCSQGPSSCWADSEGNSGCEPAQALCYPSSSVSPGYPETPVGTPTPGGTPTTGEGDVGQTPVPTPGPGVPQGPTDPGSTATPPSPGAPATPEPPSTSEPPSTGPGETPPRGSEHGHGSKFSLWGCSIDGVGSSSASSPWMWLSLGLGAVFLRRRRAR